MASHGHGFLRVSHFVCAPARFTTPAHRSEAVRNARSFRPDYALHSPSTDPVRLFGRPCTRSFPSAMNTNFRHTSNRPFVTRTEFGLWLASAETGTVLQYHDGFLALDTMVVGSRFSAAIRQELIDVAGHARWASDEGMVHLLQRRLGPGRFVYLAVMRKKPGHRQHVWSASNRS
jgi:hypothetical protein